MDSKFLVRDYLPVFLISLKIFLLVVSLFGIYNQRCSRWRFTEGIAFAEGVIDTIIGVLDAFGGFLVFTNKKSEEGREWLKQNRGDEAAERYDGHLVH